MKDPKLPVEGGCRCDQVRIKVSAPPLLTMACHCTGCQKMTSSAYSLSAAIPAEGFEVIRGEPVVGGLHGASRHFFCPHCMSWMFTRPEGLDWFVNIRSTMLDDTGGTARICGIAGGRRLSGTDRRIRPARRPLIRASAFRRRRDIADRRGGHSRCAHSPTEKLSRPPACGLKIGASCVCKRREFNARETD